MLMCVTDVVKPQKIIQKQNLKEKEKTSQPLLLGWVIRDRRLTVFDSSLLNVQVQQWKSNNSEQSNGR